MRDTLNKAASEHLEEHVQRLRERMALLQEQRDMFEVRLQSTRGASGCAQVKTTPVVLFSLNVFSLSLEPLPRP